MSGEIGFVWQNYEKRPGQLRAAVACHPYTIADEFERAQHPGRLALQGQEIDGL